MLKKNNNKTKKGQRVAQPKTMTKLKKKHLVKSNGGGIIITK